MRDFLLYISYYSIWFESSLKTPNYSEKKMITKNSIKSYCILGYQKNTDTYFGYVENSFNMSMSKTHTKIYKIIPWGGVKFDKPLTRSDKLEVAQRQKDIISYLQKDVDTLNKQYKTVEFFIVRVNSKNCPVIFDWKTYKKSTGKWNYRNIPFVKKERKS